MSGVVPEAASYPSPRTAWTVTAILTFAYLVSFIDRQILNLLVTPIKRDLGVSDTQMGLLIGLAFSVFYTGMGLILGRLADIVNRVRLISIGVAVWSAMTALSGFSANFTQLFLARIGVGVGEAALSPAAMSLIADHYPSNLRAMPMSIYYLGAIVGGGLALIAGGPLIDAITRFDVTAWPVIGGLKPWQLTFIAAAVPGILVLALMAGVREPVRIGIDSAAPPEPVSRTVAFLRANARTFFCHNIGFAIFTVWAYGSSAWIPTLFIRTFGWSMSDVGLIYGPASLIGGIAGIVAGGWGATRLIARAKDGGYALLTWSAGATAIPGVLAPLAPAPELAVAGLAVLAFAGAVPTGIALAVIQQATPNRFRGQVAALYLLLSNLIGLSLGPALVGVFTDRVFMAEAAVGQSMALLAAIMLPTGAIILAAGRAAFRRSVEAMP